MTDKTREILRRLHDKKTLDEISKELDVRKSTLKAWVDSLIHQGYLGEINYGSGCKMCTMGCNTGQCCPDIIMYTLTDKGHARMKVKRD